MKKLIVGVLVLVLGFVAFNIITGSKKPVDITPPQVVSVAPVTATSTGVITNSITWQGCMPSEKVQCDVWVAKADGTGVVNLTNSPTVFDLDPHWSPDRTKIIFASKRGVSPDIYVMNADGSNEKQLTNDPNFETFASFSPDAKKIIFSRMINGVMQIFTMNADGSNVKQLTDSVGGTQGDAGFLSGNEEPVFSPDGTKILFDSNRTGKSQLFIMNADGSDQKQLIVSNGNDRYPAWSPDGKMIAFGSDRDGDFEVYTMKADGTALTQLTFNKNFPDSDPAWSPDGKSMVFTSAREKNAEIFIMNADGSNQRNFTNAPNSFDGGADW
jgi:Tol biopolymer transport system component